MTRAETREDICAELLAALRQGQEQIDTLRERLADTVRAFEFYAQTKNDGWLSAGGLDRAREALFVSSSLADAAIAKAEGRS